MITNDTGVFYLGRTFLFLLTSVTWQSCTLSFLPKPLFSGGYGKKQREKEFTTQLDLRNKPITNSEEEYRLVFKSQI